MKHAEKIVTIEKIVPNGYGLGFCEGSVVFVSLAAKGDKVRVRIREKKGKVLFAEITEIIEPSSERRTAPCDAFGICGGCNFQQMTYEAQLRSKTEIIRDCLQRIAKIDYADEIPAIGSQQEFAYRSRAQWHAHSKARKIGYFKRYSHQIIDVQNCPVLTERLQETLTDLRENLDWSSVRTDLFTIETAANGSEVSLYSADIVEPTKKIGFSAGGNRYYYGAESFFQGNQFLIEDLLETAIAGAIGKKALDLYCGVGLFSLALARNFANVTGIEANANAIEFAKENAELNRLPNVEFYAEGVNDWLADNPQDEVDFILLDPPRSGTEKETIGRILQIKPRQISYVSCDPATLARDLKRV